MGQPDQCSLGATSGRRPLVTMVTVARHKERCFWPLPSSAAPAPATVVVDLTEQGEEARIRGCRRASPVCLLMASLVGEMVPVPPGSRHGLSDSENEIAVLRAGLAAELWWLRRFNYTQLSPGPPASSKQELLGWNYSCLLFWAILE